VVSWTCPNDVVRADVVKEGTKGKGRLGEAGSIASGIPNGGKPIEGNGGRTWKDGASGTSFSI